MMYKESVALYESHLLQFLPSLTIDIPLCMCVYVQDKEGDSEGCCIYHCLFSYVSIFQVAFQITLSDCAVTCLASLSHA